MSDGPEHAVRGLAAAGAASSAAPAAPRFDVPADRLLQDWQRAHARAVAYLEALGVDAQERAALAGEAVRRALHVEPWTTQSDAAGRFTVRMLPAVDQITFVASHRDHARCQFRIEGREPAIEVPMEPGGRISGTVVMPDGSPAIRVEVACQGRGMGYGWTFTDERGAFTLEGLGLNESTVLSKSVYDLAASKR